MNEKHRGSVTCQKNDIGPEAVLGLQILDPLTF